MTLGTVSGIASLILSDSLLLVAVVGVDVILGSLSGLLCLILSEIGSVLLGLVVLGLLLLELVALLT